jgi:outer membrane lipoprotein carrier protein
MKKTPGLLFVGLLFTATSALAEVSKTQLTSLRNVIIRYQQSAYVEMDLEKTVVSEILGREKTNKGKSFLAPKRIRLEIFEPDKSLIVYDGSTLWNVQYPPAGSGGKVQVAKAKLDQKNQNQILLGDLLVEQGLLAKFDLLDATKDGDVLEITAKPKGHKIQVADLKFRVNLKDKVIQEIEYSDELSNKTTMKFSGTIFQKKKNAKIFQYQPEKGAQVTEL